MLLVFMKSVKYVEMVLRYIKTKSRFVQQYGTANRITLKKNDLVLSVFLFLFIFAFFIVTPKHTHRPVAIPTRILEF